jgi:hypothetical protein
METMVENALATQEPTSAIVPEKSMEKIKKTKRFSSGSKLKDDEDVDWCNTTEDDIGSDEEEWNPVEPQSENPSTWDPKELNDKTNGSWKERNETRRVQDLPSPSVDDVPPEQRKLHSEEEEQWPFKEPCAFEEKNRHKRTSKSHPSASSNIHSIGASQKGGQASGEHPCADKPPVGPTRQGSDEFNDDIEEMIKENAEVEDGETNGNTEAWKMRETWKSSSHSKSSGSESSGRRSGSKKGRKADVTGSGAGDEDEIEDLGVNSFHTLKKDADKKLTRSSSRGRKTPTGGRSGRTSRNKTPTGGRPSRRKMKDRASDDDNAEEENGTEQVKLKGDNSGTPGSRGSRERRRARQRVYSDDPGADYETELSTIAAPRSAGKRPPTARRSQLRRASSERFRRAVEEVDHDSEAIQWRAHETLSRANNELSQSAHGGLRRYHSGTGSLDRRSYHGTDYSRRPHVDSRRTPRRPVRHYEDVDSAGSFGGDSYDSYEDGASVYSAHTLESIEDFEDFTGMDFQTPGMVDFDAEVLDLMQRANPETTAHLDRRVHRKRDQVSYDQNMPMMTRQALLTRQASSQVQRQFVDGDNVDRRRLLLRTDSMSSANSHHSKDFDELTLSNHRSLRGAPGRRAPPRSRSSGLGAMVPGGGGARSSDPENRRGVFRTRSSTGTNSFKQYPNKPNRVQSMTRRDQIEPHSMRGAPSSGDSLLRRRSLQRAKSTTSLRRASDHRVITPQKEEVSSDESGSDSEDSDVVSDSESPTPSPRKQIRRLPPAAARRPPPRAKSEVIPRKKIIPAKPVDKKDMTNKRNRRKLHLLMYEAKMGIEMKDLFKKVQEGVPPRSPIKTLMMPSP